MKISRRTRKTDDAEDVRWLKPTRLRTTPRRGGWIVLLALVLLSSAAVFAVFSFVGPRRQAPSQTEARQAPPPAVQPPVIPPRPPVSEPPQPQPQPQPQEPVTQADSTPPPVEPAPQPAPAQSEPEIAAVPEDDIQPAPPASAAGAFPTPSSEVSDEPDPRNFAAYLNEAAPDEAAARTLMVEAQRRYSAALAGGRLSYRRVRLNDGYVFRLRISNLTRSRAEETCQALVSLGGGCEVGPR